MKIKSLQIVSENIPLKKPFVISYSENETSTLHFVEIETTNGLKGLGSASPNSQVTGEGDSHCIEALKESKQWLLGEDIREKAKLNLLLEEKLPNTPAARAALDMALWDLFAQHLDLPLYKVLGGNARPLTTSITIGIKTIQESLKEAKEYIKQGFKILKIKCGKNVEEDLERLEKIRELFPSLKIRIDPNQGYTIQQLITLFPHFQRLDIELIEQPLSVKLLNEQRKLDLKTLQTLAADESLVTAKNAVDLGSSPFSCQIFNIKLMKSGGITPALTIATLASIFKKDLMWGCNSESRLSITAALHTALACRNTKYIDLDGHFDLKYDLVSGGFRFEEGSLIPLTNKGLSCIFSH
jgi:L-alanine-DL-glutamate epimerase-like enolase superfamily enzyme